MRVPVRKVCRSDASTRFVKSSVRELGKRPQEQALRYDGSMENNHETPPLAQCAEPTTTSTHSAESYETTQFSGTAKIVDESISTASISDTTETLPGSTQTTGLDYHVDIPQATNTDALAAPRKPRIIVMHASVGSGHRSAAMAIAQAFELLRDEAASQANSDATTGNAFSSTTLQDVLSDPASITDNTSSPTTLQNMLSDSEGVAGGTPSPKDATNETPHPPTPQSIRANIPIPKDLEVEVIDILDWGRIVFDGDHAASLFTGATRPIYDLTWRFTLTGRFLWGGGTAWSHIMYPSFTEHVRKVRPLAIVCTHITAANVAVGARMLSGLEFPIVSVPTDYETEGFWPHRSTDLFCVANEFMAETLRPRKVAEESIRITGIPTRDDFRRSYDQRTTREHLGLPQDKSVVLALAGAKLSRPYVHFREALDKLLPYLHALSNMHFVIVAGNDADYARHVRQECAEMGLSNITVLDYVEDMAALMAASNLVICKSGGLVVTECLCAQVPMVLLGRAYGQEKVNVRMLTATGAAMHVTTFRELVNTLRYIEANPESMRSMLVNGRFLRHPNAARDIARATFELAAHPKNPNNPQRKKHFVHFYWGGKPAHTR